MIQLSGTKADYVLDTSPTGLPTGIAIYLNKPSGEPDELISIIKGSSDLSLDDYYFSFKQSLNLTGLDGSNGFVVNGVDEFDIPGTSVSGAGDVNGDGLDDLLIGTGKANHGQSIHGESYVIFG